MRNRHRIPWTWILPLLLATASLALSAQTLTTLHSFSGADGSGPQAALVLARNGNLYGSTSGGGANRSDTVFEITTNGTLTTLHNFNQFILPDGNDPMGAMIQAADGNLYGTTVKGGVGRFGSVYRIAPDGSFRMVLSLNYTPLGAIPYAGLTAGVGGLLYGTATHGGINGSGTIYAVTPFGQAIKLHDFGGEGAAEPEAGLVLGNDGNFYGTTFNGGSFGCGIVYRVTPGGNVTALHSFGGQGDGGCQPYAAMGKGSDGNFYGTTSMGGAPNGANAGLVYRITPSGVYTVLHVFNRTDGTSPFGALLLSSDGNFYGTTVAGGSQNAGTIFKMTPGGTLTTLYNFCSQTNCTDGAAPYAGLVQDSHGTFYGTTFAGGGSNDGTVFSFER
ncbi:MAG TPA: choice-of-anchor tandem repeat GloVer-containing protein [Candidatus Binatia bacterium]|nr:choice-of-anchor tandem repeat GloVer-containing protein [Candidatus Binatia bacterium]